ncbi:reticulocyte-binding protein 2 a-like isoform X3, partial [Biomphalaria glabrata]
MKPYKEIVDILTHLQVVDEIHVFLVKMFEEIVSIKKQGELWVEDKQNLTFMEMKISLTKKISGVLYKCSDFS